MGFLTRLISIVTGRAEEAVESRATPEDQVRLFVRRMESEVRNLEAAVASAITEEKRLKLQVQDLLHQSTEWERRATYALQEGREDLAREALAKKGEADEQAAALGPAWERQKSVSEQLKQNLRGAKGRVDQAVRDYKTQLARLQAARASQQLAKTMSTTTVDAPMRLMGDLTERILKIEAETEATLELNGQGQNVVALEQQFRDMERGKRTDDALARLKASLHKNQLPAGGSDVTSRVEDLKQKLKAG